MTPLVRRMSVGADTTRGDTNSALCAARSLLESLATYSTTLRPGAHSRAVFPSDDVMIFSCWIVLCVGESGCVDWRWVGILWQCAGFLDLCRV